MPFDPMMMGQPMGMSPQLDPYSIQRPDPWVPEEFQLDKGNALAEALIQGGGAMMQAPTLMSGLGAGGQAFGQQYMDSRNDQQRTHAMAEAQRRQQYEDTVSAYQDTLGREQEGYERGLDAETQARAAAAEGRAATTYDQTNETIANTVNADRNMLDEMGVDTTGMNPVELARKSAEARAIKDMETQEQFQKNQFLWEEAYKRDNVTFSPDNMHNMAIRMMEGAGKSFDYDAEGQKVGEQYNMSYEDALNKAFELASRIESGETQNMTPQEFALSAQVQINSGQTTLKKVEAHLNTMIASGEITNFEAGKLLGVIEQGTDKSKPDPFKPTAQIKQKQKMWWEMTGPQPQPGGIESRLNRPAQF